MRNIDSKELEILLRRGFLKSTPMIWVGSRERSTGNVIGVGFWKGSATEDIPVRNILTGVTSIRRFYAETILSLDSLRYEAGLNIHPVGFSLSSIHTAVQLCFREHEPRGATVQIYTRTYDPTTFSPVSIRAKWCGNVDRITINRPPPGEGATIDVDCVPLTRELTISSALKKSDTVQRKRKKGATEDRIRRYKDSAGQWDIPWGAEDRG